MDSYDRICMGADRSQDVSGTRSSRVMFCRVERCLCIGRQLENSPQFYPHGPLQPPTVTFHTYSKVILGPGMFSYLQHQLGQSLRLHECVALALFLKTARTHAHKDWQETHTHTNTLWMHIRQLTSGNRAWVYFDVIVQQQCLFLSKISTDSNGIL